MAKKHKNSKIVLLQCILHQPGFQAKKMFDSWIVGVNVWKLLDRDWLFSKIVIKMDSLKK